MRPRTWIGGLAAALCVAAFARAQAQRPEAVVTAQEVEVRSGPSAKLYATSKLRQGDRVRIVEEKDSGWLAIEPPLGSFSWIKAAAIQRLDARQGVVHTGSSEVLVGSALVADEPTQISTRLVAGAAVVILEDRPAQKGGEQWLPIQPPPQEVRYIPASAVAKAAPPVQAVSAPAPAASATPAAGGSSLDPLLAQAQAAENAGDLTKAEALYTQLARTTRDPQVQQLGSTKVEAIRQRLRGTAAAYTPAAPVSQAPAAPAAYTPPAAAAAPPSGYVYGQPVPPAPQPQQAVSQYTYQRDPSAPLTQQSPMPQPRPAAVPPQWSPPGYLRHAALKVEARPTYALESSEGMLRLYVCPGPGMNLEPYVGRNVTVYGPAVYSGELRTNYMLVNQVNPVP